jgi:hypothetical protein
MHAPPKPKSKNISKATAHPSNQSFVDALTQSNAAADISLGGQSPWATWTSRGPTNSLSGPKQTGLNFSVLEADSARSLHNDTRPTRLPSPSPGDGGEVQSPLSLKDAWTAYRAEQEEAAKRGKRGGKEPSTTFTASSHSTTTEPRNISRSPPINIVSSRLESGTDPRGDADRTRHNTTFAHIGHHRYAAVAQEIPSHQLPPTPQASEAASPPDLTSPHLIQYADPEELSTLPPQVAPTVNLTSLRRVSFPGGAGAQAVAVPTASVQPVDRGTNKRKRSEGSVNLTNQQMPNDLGTFPISSTFHSQQRRCSEPVLRVAGQYQGPYNPSMLQFQNGQAAPGLMQYQIPTNPSSQIPMGALYQTAMSERLSDSNSTSIMNNTSSTNLNSPIYCHDFHQQAPNAMYQQFQPSMQQIPNPLMTLPNMLPQHNFLGEVQLRYSLPNFVPYSRELTLPQFDVLDQRLSNSEMRQLDGNMISIRRDILKKAASGNDVFFLFLHQLLCHWCLGQKECIPAPIRSLPQFEVSMSMIVQWFGCQVCETVKLVSMLYVNFPMPLPRVAMDYSLQYHDFTSQLQEMMERLPNWQSRESQAEIDRRRYPWLAYELSSHFGIRSATLMEVVTRVTLRRIWHTHFTQISQVEQYVASGMTVFMKDCSGYSPQATVQEYLNLYQQALSIVQRHPVELVNPMQQNILSQGNNTAAQMERRTSGSSVATWRSSAQSFITNVSGRIPTKRQQIQPAMIQTPLNVSDTTTPPSSPVMITAGLSSTTSISNQDPLLAPSSSTQQNVVSDIVGILPRLIEEIDDGNDFGESNLENNTWSLLLQNFKSSLAQTSLAPLEAPSIQPHPFQSRSIAGKVLTNSFLVPRQFSAIPEARVPEPIGRALHQSHLMSPILKPRELELSNPPIAARVSICQYVSSFALAPFNLGTEKSFNHTLEFACSRESFARIPKTVNQNGANIREVDSDTYQYRIRCVQPPQPANKDNRLNSVISLSDWICFDMALPIWLDIVLNNTILQGRQKPKYGHYKRDLPYDISYLVKLGENHMEVCINLMGIVAGSTFKVKPAPENCWIAVEVIELITPNAIIALAKQQSLDAKVVVDKIIEQMSVSDEDVITVSSDKVISMCDPFTSTLLSELPARSINCRHNECFSLENFIQSRPLQVQPDDHYGIMDLPKSSVTQVDVWRCPICSADARPPMLCIDEWMLGIRNEIVAKELTHISAINVDASGNWTIKEEEASTNDAEILAKVASPVVISLLDLD